MVSCNGGFSYAGCTGRVNDEDCPNCKSKEKQRNDGDMSAKKIAKSLNPSITEKPFRIDGIFVKTAGQTTTVPIIYLESENIATNSHEEVYKLCCLNSPLKVLIVCTDWDSEIWRNKIIDGHWHYIVEDF